MNQDFFRTNWIWMQDEIHDEREYPCIVYFRKEFNDAGKIRPEETTVCITASIPAFISKTWEMRRKRR